jgi:hypothetical protein
MQGIAWTPKMYACDKVLRFGNDATNGCTTATVIPVNFAGRTGHLHVYVYVLLGNTPLLFPRPLMEHFGMLVDFGKKRLQWDKVWAPVRQRSGGVHYLLDLCKDPSSVGRGLRKLAFAHAPAELSRQGCFLELEDATSDPTTFATTTTTDDATTTDKTSKDLTPRLSATLRVWWTRPQPQSREPRRPR